MENKYNLLLSPLQIGGTYVRNRMIDSNSSPHFLQGPEEFPADAYIAHYSGIARAGAALVTMAEWDNWPNQRSSANVPSPDFPHMQAFNVKSDAVHNYLCALLEEIHFYGSKALLAIEPRVIRDNPEQAGHPIAANAIKGQEQHLPAGDSANESAAQQPQIKKRVINMTPEQESASIKEFIEKLKFYRELGYDGISVRTDKFVRKSSNPAKSLRERCDFFVRALEAARKEMGAAFIIELVLQGQQPLGYEGNIREGEGYSVADMVEVTKMVEGIADIFTVRGKDVASAHPLPCHFRKGEQETLEYARAIKAAGTDIIVAVNGGYQDPDDIEAELEAGTFDMVSMARTFICEPEYEKKLREGRPEDIVPCIWCNRCHGDMKAPWISVCSVNPRMGMEHKLSRMVTPAAALVKNVAVIGGGPAGMRAAVYAAQRGHKVTLFEKSDYLGGQMLHAEYFSFKWSIRDYRNWLVSQLGKCGVNVQLNTEPAPEAVAAAGFDAVIAACGARFNLPGSIKGLTDEAGNGLYPTIAEVWGREEKLGKNIIMCGGSEAGVETAMYLADAGHNVTILTRQDELAKDASKLHYITMAYLEVGSDGLSHLIPQWQKYDNISGILEVTTTEVKDNTVTYLDKSGNEHTICGDSVVICGGSSPRLTEAIAYAKTAPDFRIIGDANGAGKLWKCNRDAFAAAYAL